MGHLDNDWEWLLDWLGKPMPCGICGQYFTSEQLKERSIPATLVDLCGDGDLSILHEVVWLCENCRC